MRHVETTLQVEATPEAVLRAFSDVDAMRQWWGVDRGLVDLREGGVWALAWDVSPQGFRYITTGRITTIEPGRRLLINDLVYFNPDRPVLGPMALAVEVAPNGEGSMLTIRQEGYQDGPDWNWYYDAVCTAWPEVAKRIKTFVEAA